MRKIAILSAAALLFGVASCQKNAEKGGDEETAKGTLTVVYGFEKAQPKPGETRAFTASTAKPKTTWAANVKSLALFLADGTGIVKAALPVPVDFTKTDHAPQSFVFQNVPTGTYTAYMIANYDQTANIASTFSTSTTNVNVSTMLMNLVGAAGTFEAGVNAYKEPEEIFIAQQSGVTIVANANTNLTGTPFMLTRAISLMRFRIDKSHTVGTGATAADNSTVDFSTPEASVRVRRSGTALNYKGDVSPAAADVNFIYSAGFNTNSTVPANYAAGSLPTMWAGSEFSAWKDVNILPGGGRGVAAGAKKFNVLVAGTAPVGYVPSGQTTPLTSPTLVYWQGTVDAEVAANNILELNISLNTRGSVDVPAPLATGSLDIKVDLIEWGTIESTDVPM